MNVPIDKTIKRARAYWFIDGFTEMAAGGFLVLLAGLMPFSGRVSSTAFPSWFLSTAGKIIIANVIGILAVILILWWLKDHFTYPRTGFARGKRITLTQVLMIIRNVILFLLVPILGLLVASLLITPPGNVLASMPVWFPIGISIVWMVLIVSAGEWMGLFRFRILGGLILLSGVAIGIWQLISGLPVIPANIQLSVLRPGVVESLSRTLTSLDLLVLLSGAILIFSGFITFLRYRRENPLPYAEDV